MMKKYPLIYAIFLGLILPWILFLTGETLYQESASKGEEATKQQNTEQIQQADSITFNIQMARGQIEKLELEKYLVGVLLGEMPANFELEALKAQAVAARTFALNCHKHNNFDLCTDSSCCQNYYGINSYLADGGTQDAVDKVSAAVAETAGYVLLYDGELIEATFFSCSGGRTEDAVAVWGTDVPYLQAVDSPGEEKAAHYTDTVIFTAPEFEDRLSRDMDGLPGSWFGNVTYTTGGGVNTIQICGQTYTGSELRGLLELNSTAFIISAVGDSITITTKGFGHRVGMSQYGADAMASQGESFENILAYYYPGTYLDVYNPI